MSQAFFAPQATPLDAQAREQALRWMLEAFPNEPVAAFSIFGQFTDIPASIPIGDRPVFKGRSGMDSVSDEEDRKQMVASWEVMLGRGAYHYVLHRPGLSDVTCLWLDLLADHGVVFGIFTGISAEEREQLAPGQRFDIGSKPRLCSMRKDARGFIVEFDSAFTEILGWSADEVVGKRSLDFMHPDDHALAVENWMDLMSTPGRARSIRQRMRSKDGEWVWFEVTNNNQLADPQHGCVLCELVDISEQMFAQEQLREREQLLDRLTAALPVGVVQIDTAKQILFANDRFREMLGDSGQDSFEVHFAAIGPEDRERLMAAIEKLLQLGEGSDLDVDLPRCGGAAARRLTITLRPLSHEDGSVSGAIACIDDVTERAQMQAELERRATFDELTGCHNRASVMKALERNLDSDEGAAERAVMFVDLDGFKEINDRYGHIAGDELLRGVSQRLRSGVRSTDMVGRIGGDEFLIVCPEIGGPEEAMSLAERLAGTVTIEGIGPERIECTISVGVAWCLGSELNADAVVARADRAMYDSKRARRGRPALAAAA